MSKSGKEHYQAMKRILRYMKGTKNIGIIFQSDSQCNTLGYLNLDFAIPRCWTVHYWLFFHHWWASGYLEIYSPQEWYYCWWRHNICQWRRRRWQKEYMVEGSNKWFSFPPFWFEDKSSFLMNWFSFPPWQG